MLPNVPIMRPAQEKVLVLHGPPVRNHNYHSTDRQCLRKEKNLFVAEKWRRFPSFQSGLTP
jgi:hypothetical protein